MTSTNTNSRKTQTLPPPLNIPEFPGEDYIKEFKHDALKQYKNVDFYISEEAHSGRHLIWDECMSYVGTVFIPKNEIYIYPRYQPDDELELLDTGTHRTNSMIDDDGFVCFFNDGSLGRCFLHFRR